MLPASSTSCGNADNRRIRAALAFKGGRERGVASSGCAVLGVSTVLRRGVAKVGAFGVIDGRLRSEVERLRPAAVRALTLGLPVLVSVDVCFEGVPTAVVARVLDGLTTGTLLLFKAFDVTASSDGSAEIGCASRVRGLAEASDV